MSLLRPFLVAVVALALAGDAAGCTPMASAGEAMQCCETMPCDSHSAGHRQGCFETMPSMHAPFFKGPLKLGGWFDGRRGGRHSRFSAFFVLGWRRFQFYVGIPAKF